MHMDVLFRAIDRPNRSPSYLLLSLDPRLDEVTPGDEDFEELLGDALRGPLEIDCHGFAARFSRATFPRDLVAAFAAQLRAFAPAHQGEATLEGWLHGDDAAGTVRLRVWAPDLARHAALEVAIECAESLGNATFDDRLHVAFPLDPNRWEEPLSALQAALVLPHDTTGEGGHSQPGAATGESGAE
jgi:hypothetical protein